MNPIRRLVDLFIEPPTTDALLTPEGRQAISAAVGDALDRAQPRPTSWLRLLGVVVVVSSFLILLATALLGSRLPSRFAYEVPSVADRVGVQVFDSANGAGVELDAAVAALTVWQVAGASLDISLPASRERCAELFAASRFTCDAGVVEIEATGPLTLGWSGPVPLRLTGTNLGSALIERPPASEADGYTITAGYRGTEQGNLNVCFPFPGLTNMELRLSAQVVARLEGLSTSSVECNQSVVLRIRPMLRSPFKPLADSPLEPTRDSLGQLLVPKVFGDHVVVELRDVTAVRADVRAREGSFLIGPGTLSVNDDRSTVGPGELVAARATEIELRLEQLSAEGGVTFYASAPDATSVTTGSGQTVPTMFERHTEIALAVGGTYFSFLIALFSLSLPPLLRWLERRLS